MHPQLRLAKIIPASGTTRSSCHPAISNKKTTHTHTHSSHWFFRDFWSIHRSSSGPSHSGGRVLRSHRGARRRLRAWCTGVGAVGSRGSRTRGSGSRARSSASSSASGWGAQGDLWVSGGFNLSIPDFTCGIMQTIYRSLWGLWYLQRWFCRFLQSCATRWLNRNNQVCCGKPLAVVSPSNSDNDVFFHGYTMASTCLNWNNFWDWVWPQTTRFNM